MPANHRVLLENERVRVLEMTVAVGAITPVHTHRWPSVEYVLIATNFVRRDGDGNVVFDTRTANAEPRPSDVLWSEPFPPHSVENVGETELRVIMVELKDRGSNPRGRRSRSRRMSRNSRKQRDADRRGSRLRRM